jgi:hypothetical protein
MPAEQSTNIESFPLIGQFGPTSTSMMLSCESLSSRDAAIPLGPFPALTRGLIEGLLDATRTPAPELGVLASLRDLATAILFAFAELDELSVADVANVALALERHIGDAVENGDGEEALRVGDSGLVFLTRLAAYPAFLDAAIPAFLTAFPELPTGDALAVVVVLCDLIAVLTVEFIFVALLIKHAFGATITRFLGHDGRFGAALHVECGSCGFLQVLACFRVQHHWASEHHNPTIFTDSHAIESLLSKV